MTASYPARVATNILPKSAADKLPEAFEEWSFTEETIDHEQAIETCQLCEQEELRYHFEIRNRLTSHTLWVGSQCILKFELSVFEAGRKLSSTDAKRKLERLTQKMRLDSCISALERLAAAEPNPILPNALKYFRQHKRLTPKFAFVVLWRLRVNNIDHSPSFFKVELKRDLHKQHLRDMPLSQVHEIWPALTGAQRQTAMRMGHSAPKT